MRAATITAHGRPPEVLDRPDPVPGDGELLVAVTAVPLTPLDLLCATGTSYFGPPALPYVPGVQAVGVVRRGPGHLLGSRVWFPTVAGMAPGDGGLAELARRPCRPGRASSRPTSRTPPWRPWACRPSRPGRSSRDAPACGPASRCSSSAPVAWSGRWPSRRRGCSGRAGSSPPAGPRPRASGRLACGADAVVDLRSDDDAATLADPVPRGVRGRGRRRRRPARRHPGDRGGLGARRRRSARQPRQQRGSGRRGRLRRPAQPRRPPCSGTRTTPCPTSVAGSCSRPSSGTRRPDGSP